MSSAPLLIAYIVIFVVQFILLVASIRKKQKKLWRKLFLIQLISILVSIGLGFLYDRLPGYGFMPGLSYLGEVLFSFGAAMVYGLFFLISGFCNIVTMQD